MKKPRRVKVNKQTEGVGNYLKYRKSKAERRRGKK